MFKMFKMFKCSNIQTTCQVKFYHLLVQAWGSTSPHKHWLTSLKEHGNNCRNPDNYSSPWYVPFDRLLCFGKEKLPVLHPSLYAKDFLTLNTHFGWQFTMLERSLVYCYAIFFCFLEINNLVWQLIFAFLVNTRSLCPPKCQ